MVWIKKPSPHFSKERTYKARKTHMCFYCRKPIEAGTHYRLLVGKNYEGFYVLRIHVGGCEE